MEAPPCGQFQSLESVVAWDACWSVGILWAWVFLHGAHSRGGTSLASICVALRSPPAPAQDAPNHTAFGSGHHSNQPSKGCVREARLRHRSPWRPHPVGPGCRMAVARGTGVPATLHLGLCPWRERSQVSPGGEDSLGWCHSRQAALPPVSKASLTTASRINFHS